MNLTNRKMTNRKMTHCLLSIVLCLLSLLGLTSLPWPGSAWAAGKAGVVMARAVVLDANGQPILVQFRDDGSEAGVVPLGAWADRVGQLQVLSAAEYRDQVRRLADFRARHLDLATGAELLSRAQYLAGTYPSADDREHLRPGSLPEGIASVLVRPKRYRLAGLGAEQLVMLAFTVDLSQPYVLPDDSRSLVLTPQGQVIAASPHQIGPRAGFFGDPQAPQDLMGRPLRRPEDQIFGPVPGVKVSVDEMLYPGGVDTTDADGRYRLQFRAPPCPAPGEYFSYTTDIWAELRYANFKPLGAPVLPYYVRRRDYTACEGPGSYSAVPAYAVDLYVDVMVLTGTLQLQNGHQPIPVTEETRYQITTPDTTPIVPDWYDFDGDGQTDTVVLGSLQPQAGASQVEQFVPVAATGGPPPTHEGVYLSSSGRRDGPPDLLRLLTVARQTQPNGLLASIGRDDLQNTDILVFRDSTGELVMERQGLRDAEIDGRVQLGAGEGDTLFYRLLLRGPRDSSLNVGATNRLGSWSDWASRNHLAAPLHRHEANHLKAGEWITLVAINRATGYTATARVPLVLQGGGTIGVSIPPLVLRAPNLRIWAERQHTTAAGLTAGEQHTGVIGGEGAARTQDERIVVYSEWLAHDGRALPEGLGMDDGEQYGLTGRLTKVIAPNALQADNGSGLSHFPIGPGRRIQVLQVQDNLAQPEHFYIHVAGEPKDGLPIFGPAYAIAADGTKTWRPGRLVPFQIPLYDERQHWIETQAWRDSQNAQTDPARPAPPYLWAWRPEYQFTRISLQIDELKRVTEDEISHPVYTHLYQAEPLDQPVIASSDELLEAFYSLALPQFNRLDPLEGPQELVLALGEQEIAVTLTGNGTIRFDNIEHLAMLDASDWLTLRLYVNQDAGNVLWEYAFGEAPQVAPETGYISADRPYLDLGAFLARADLTQQKTTVLRWALRGDTGGLSRILTESDTGLFLNQLHASVRAGSLYTVDVEIQESEDKRFVPQVKTSIGPFEVVPGVPDRVILRAEHNKTEVLSDGLDETVVIAEVIDRSGNHVEDGTPVSWSMGYSGQNPQVETETLGGFARMTYKAGIETTPTEIIARTGQAVGQLDITKKPFDFELTVSSNTVPAGSSHTLSLAIQANAYSDHPLEIHWHSDKGKISGAPQLTGTSLTATFEPGMIPGDALITATIAGVEKALGVLIKPQAPGAIALDLATIASARSGGQVQVERIDGTTHAVTVPTSTSATLYGIPGTEFHLQLGSFFAPNAQPMAQYALSAIDYGDVDAAGNPIHPFIYDHINQLNAAVSGHITEDLEQSYSQPGTSLHFDGSGTLTIPADPKLEITDDLFAIIRFRRDAIRSACLGGCPTNPTPLLERAADAELIRSHTGLGISWVLDLVEDDHHQLHLRATAQTDQGRYAVVSEAVISDEQWYLAGLRIRGGRLELGLNDERQSVGMAGKLANVGRSQIVLADDFQGHLDEFEIGQEDQAHALVTVNGRLSEGVQIGSDGTANITLNATQTDISLPQMVGFTGTYQVAGSTQTRELEILDKVVSRMTGLPGWAVAHASNPVTTSQEQGLLVTSGEVFGWAIEWVDSKIENALGPNVYGPVKQAAKLLYTLLGISDVVTIVDAIVKMATRRIEDVDALDVSFAVLGLGLTVVAVIAAPTTAGAGTSAALGLKASLAGAKKLLKEMFSLGLNPAGILRAGGSSVRYIFSLLIEFRNGGAAVKARAMTDLQELGNSFSKLISQASVGLWQFYLGTAASIEGLRRFIRFMKYADTPVQGCVVQWDWSAQDQLYARLSERLFGFSSIRKAEAAPACPIGLIPFVAGVMARNGADATRIANEIADLASFMAKHDMHLTIESFQTLEKLSVNGHGQTVMRFLENVESGGLGSSFTMGALKADYLDKTVMDELLDAVGSVPRGQSVDAIKLYDNILKELGIKSIGNVRGIYGEGRTFRELSSGRSLVLGRPDLVLNPQSIKIGENVKTRNASNVQGVDVDASLVAVETGGRPVGVEVKNHTSAKSKQEILHGELRNQAEKHMETFLLKKLLRNSNTRKLEWENGQKPHIHYELMGNTWVKADGSSRVSVEHLKDMLLSECKKLAALQKVSPKFDCANDITVHVVPERLIPLTANN